MKWMLVPLLVCLSVLPALATPEQDEVYSAFEWFCLSQLSDPAKVPALMTRIQQDPLPADRAAAFLNGMKGTAWIVENPRARYVVVLTGDNVCSVEAPHTSASGVIDLLKQKTKSVQVDSHAVGSMQHDYYAVTFPDPAMGPDQHAVVDASYQTLQSTTGVGLTTFPEALLKREGTPPPVWP